MEKFYMAKIIVVDDSKLARDIVAKALAEAGHDVQVVEPLSVFDVLKAIRETKPHLVVTDYNMPHVKAETLVRVLREDPYLPDLKVMVLSANHDSEAVSSMLQRGVDGYAFKGNIGILVERVKEVLG
jgi:CheY-like chemotaxis protein